MKRREVVGLIACAAMLPMAARAQQPKMYRAGFLLGPSAESAASLFQALREGLRERSYGAFQGHDSTEIEALFPDAYAAWQTRDPGFAPEGGESQREFYHRVLHALEPIVAAHPGGRIACVAHGGVLDCVYRFANGIELSAPRSYQLLNTSINVVDYVDGRAQVVRWADVSHLEAASDDDDGYRRVL